MAAITVLGAWLRLAGIESAQFREDDYQVTTLVTNLVRYASFPTGVGSSVGIANGPAVPYLLGLPALFSDTHASLAIFTAGLNTLAIPLFYVLTRSLFGPRAGLLAVALLAVNPWAVVTGRRLWVNAFLVPTAILLLWSVHRAAASNTRAAWVAAGLAISASVQVHLSSVANGLALAALAPWLRVVWRGALLGVAVAVVFMLPWWGGSFFPDLARVGRNDGIFVGPAPTLEIWERVTRVVTGGGYQAVSLPGTHLIDASSQPFELIDGLSRVVATLGWMGLLWVGWRERTRRPAAAATCLVAAGMVGVAVLALIRPPQAGALAAPGPHQLINLLPPLLLGIAMLASVSTRAIRAVGAAVAAVMFCAQLTLAVPFFAMLGEYWPNADYGIPWQATGQLVAEARGRAALTQAPIFVGGDGENEQQVIPARLLQRDYPFVRLHDARDGVVFRDDVSRVIVVTTNDGQGAARFLRREFSGSEVFTQALPGFGWTRRIFDLAPSEVESWAQVHLPPITDPGAEGALLKYTHGGLLGPARSGDAPVLAVLWGFAAEPVEAFFTEVVLQGAEGTLLRESHLAYPAPFLQPGDWETLRMLNLFDLPATLDVRSVVEVQLVPNGLRSGRDIAPTVRFRP
ncbi:MAG: glycosyltransferase family 39 protein [Chloroflexi bacterium]|nr:glycosyltransferase family 39 protein [Chloroflexota bacterium]